jgi:hypothetical protein
MINQRKFSTFTGKFDNFEEIQKIPRNMKCKNEKIVSYADKMSKKYKNSDGRLSYKNRRTINKDFKDFMNNQ